MSATETMKWMGRGARSRTGAVGHAIKDRALEKRLRRASDEADRLRRENDLLRDEVSETRSEHRRILDALEARLAEPATVEVDVESRSHRGRWALLLIALGGGTYAWLRARANGFSGEAWVGGRAAVTERGTATAI